MIELNLDDLMYQYKVCFGNHNYELFKIWWANAQKNGINEEQEESLERIIFDIYNKAIVKGLDMELTDLTEDELKEAIDNLIFHIRDNEVEQTEETLLQEKENIKNILNVVDEITKDAFLTSADRTINNRVKSLLSALDNDSFNEDRREEALRIIFNNLERIINYNNRIQNQDEEEEEEIQPENIEELQTMPLLVILEGMLKKFKRGIPAENNAYTIIYSIKEKIKKGKELNKKDKKNLIRILNSYKGISRFNIPNNATYNEEIIDSLLSNSNEESIPEPITTEEETPTPHRRTSRRRTPRRRTSGSRTRIDDPVEEDIEEVIEDVENNNRRAEKLYLKSIAAFVTGAILGAGVATLTPLPAKAVAYGVPAFFVTSSAIQIVDGIKQAKIERIQSAEDYENEHPERPKTNKILTKFKRFLTSKYTRLFVTGFAVGFGGATFLKNRGIIGKHTGKPKGNTGGNANKTTGGKTNKTTGGNTSGNKGLKDPVVKKDPITEGAKNPKSDFTPLTKEDIIKNPKVLKDLKVDLSGIKGYSSSDATKSTSIIDKLAKNAKIVKSGNGKYIRNGRIITKSVDGDYLEWADLNNKNVIKAINKALKLKKR